MMRKLRAIAAALLLCGYGVPAGAIQPIEVDNPELLVVIQHGWHLPSGVEMIQVDFVLYSNGLFALSDAFASTASPMQSHYFFGVLKKPARAKLLAAAAAAFATLPPLESNRSYPPFSVSKNLYWVWHSDSHLYQDWNSNAQLCSKQDDTSESVADSFCALLKTLSGGKHTDQLRANVGLYLGTSNSAASAVELPDPKAFTVERSHLRFCYVGDDVTTFSGILDRMPDPKQKPLSLGQLTGKWELFSVTVAPPFGPETSKIPFGDVMVSTPKICSES